MSSNFTDIVISSVKSVFSLPALSIIDDIKVDTTIDEQYEDALEITDHPVQVGAQISDHSFKRPMELRLRCGWSDANSSAAIGAISNFLTGSNSSTSTSGEFTGGSMAASDYVAGVYSQLLQLQETRDTFSVTTGLRVYDDVLLTSIRVRRDVTTSSALMVEATMRQVILVDTQTATVPPQADQATPQATADTVNAGPQQPQAITTTPASGGNAGNPFGGSSGSPTGPLAPQSYDWQYFYDQANP